MNKEHLALILSMSCLSARPASAVTAAQSLLASPTQALQREGFYGADKTAVLDAPAIPAPVPTAETPDDHTKAVLAAYAQEVLSTAPMGELGGKMARRLGFSATTGPAWTSDDNMPLKGIGRSNKTT